MSALSGAAQTVQGWVVAAQTKKNDNTLAAAIVVKTEDGKKGIITASRAIIHDLGIEEVGRHLFTKNLMKVNFEVSTDEHGQLVASRLMRPSDSKYLYVPDATSSELISSVTRHLEHSAIASAVNDAGDISTNLRRNNAASLFLGNRIQAYHRVIEKNLGPENERHAIKRLLHDLERFSDMVSREGVYVKACDNLLDNVQRIENTLDLSINEAAQGVNLLADSDAVREALPDSDIDKKLPAAMVLWAAHNTIKKEGVFEGFERDNQLNAIKQSLIATSRSKLSDFSDLRKGIMIAENALLSMAEKASSDPIKADNIDVALNNLKTAAAWTGQPTIDPGNRDVEIPELERMDIDPERKDVFLELLDTEISLGNELDRVETTKRGTVVAHLTLGEAVAIDKNGVVGVRNSQKRLETIDHPDRGRVFMVDGAAVNEDRTEYALYRQSGDRISGGDNHDHTPAPALAA